MLYGEMRVSVCVDVFAFISTAQLPCESFMWYCWGVVDYHFDGIWDIVTIPFGLNDIE